LLKDIPSDIRKNIFLINEDLKASQINYLYQNCNCLVAPSYGEGFGLPMAEAMLFDLPVITTGYGGQIDFCTEETSWLIDYSFEKAHTHMNLFNSYWAKPKKKSIEENILKVYNSNSQEIEMKTKKAKCLIQDKYTWEVVRNRLQSTLDEVYSKQEETKVEKIAWVSSYNTKCGIATYSEFILNNFDKEKYKIIKLANYSDDIVDTKKEVNVVRCWDSRFDTDNTKLINEILGKNFTHVVINFNFGFFSMKNLEQIITELKKENLKITIIFHSVADVDIKGLESSLSWIKDTLQKVDNLLVHNIEDLNFLKNLDLSKMDLFPHGVTNRAKDKILRTKEVNTIASYGFLLPHKGVLELIEAFFMLQLDAPHMQLLLVTSLYPAKVSEKYLNDCLNKIVELNLTKKVKIVTDFLSDEESFELLDTADLVVMPYRKTNESASGAIRYAVSTNKPILCTKQSIFNDVEPIVHFTKGFEIKEIAESITKLIKDKNLLYSKMDKQKAWINEHDWKNVANRLENFINYERK